MAAGVPCYRLDTTRKLQSVGRAVETPEMNSLIPSGAERRENSGKPLRALFHYASPRALPYKLDSAGGGWGKNFRPAPDVAPPGDIIARNPAGHATAETACSGDPLETSRFGASGPRNV